MACQGVSLHGALLGLLQELLGCHWIRTRLCCWYLLLEVFPGRGEEAKTQAVGAGQRSNSGKKMESFQKSPWGQHHPACLHSQLGKCAVAGVVPGPFLQPLRSLLTFRCLSWEGWRRLRSTSLGVSQRLLRDASMGSPSSALQTLLGSGVGGQRGCWLCVSPRPCPLSELSIRVAGVLIDFHRSNWWVVN